MDPATSRKTKYLSPSEREPVSDATHSHRSWVKKSATYQTGDDRFGTLREDGKTPRVNSMAAAARNMDDLKFKISDGGLKKPNFVIDVDQSAEEFIRRFRENLKIERKESLEAYQEMLKRGV